MESVTGEGVQQHYARQEEWQRLFASRARQWAVSAGLVTADASREVIDRAVSEALHQRGVSRGASPSSVKKWRTGRFAPPPAELLPVLEQLLGTGSELSDLLSSITPDAPGDDGGPLADEPGSDTAGPSVPDDDGALAGHDPAEPAADADPEAASPRRDLRRRALVVAVVVAAIVLATTALLVSRRSSDDVADGRKSGGEGSCRVAVGFLPDGLSSGSSAAAWKEALKVAYQEAGGRTALGCPMGPVERQELLLTQTLPGPVDGAPGALVVVADQPDFHFYFNAALWTSYSRVSIREGETAQSLGGVPTELARDPDGHVEVELDSGMLLVAERADAPYFSVPPRYVPWWRENRERVGLPMGNPRPGEGRQDTELGFATAVRTSGIDPEMHTVPDPAAELPAEVQQGGVIISAPDGTDWWIPAAGRRQWIADVGTWSCLGGADKTVSNQVPGYAVGTLEYDGIATCED